MKFVELRKPRESHKYYVYVFATGDKPAVLYLVGSVMAFKRLLRSQNCKFDICKIW